MIQTHSKFYYGFTVLPAAQYIDFDEGAGPLSAELQIGQYTLTEFAAEIARAMNDVGELTYTVTVNRVTRAITIAADGNFELLIATGGHLGTSAFALAGFSGADLSGSDEYTGGAAGTEYKTQHKLQSYLAADDNHDVSYGTVNESASGEVEVVTFGDIQYVEGDFQYVSDIDHGVGGPFRSRADGVAQLRALMNFMTTLAPVEFMPDEDQPADFLKLRLESTPDDQGKGLKYKLKEQYGRGLPGYFNTGVLRWRVLG